VAYSASTVYKYTDFEYCYRTTEAWGAQMEADTTWTIEPQTFHFAGCGGTLINDIPRQMGRTGNSQLIIGTLGGNNAIFGDIARACIYQPRPGPWGPPYDEDPNGEGECKKNLAISRNYITRPIGGLRDDFKAAIDNIFDFKQTKGQIRSRFDLYVSSYVQFFDATTDPCSDWTFARWFSVASPKLVKPLRAEMNELVEMFNNVQSEVISNYRRPEGYNYYAHYIPVSDEFENHRFCEANHNEEDQWTSSDVWIWNLQWNDGDTGGPNKPPTAPGGDFPVMSLDTVNRTALDNLVFNGSDVNAQVQSGFGWTARPFHPKPRGHEQMKNFFIQRLKDDEVPGVIDVDQGRSPSSSSTITSAPAPTASVYCTDTSLEDGDGLCTCNVGTLTFTTFTPGGGPGNSCQASTIVPPHPPQRRAMYTTMIA
jgi:hypothetical protein